MSENSDAEIIRQIKEGIDKARSQGVDCEYPFSVTIDDENGTRTHPIAVSDMPPILADVQALFDKNTEGWINKIRLKQGQFLHDYRIKPTTCVLPVGVSKKIADWYMKKNAKWVAVVSPEVESKGTLFGMKLIESPAVQDVEIF